VQFDIDVVFEQEKHLSQADDDEDGQVEAEVGDDPTQIHSQKEEVKKEVEDFHSAAKEVDYIEDSKIDSYLVHSLGVEEPEWVESGIIDRDWWDKVLELWSVYASKC